MTPGEVLRALRRGRALSQEELARRAGVGVVTIINAETGRQQSHPGTRRKLAAALDVPVEALSSGDDDLVRRLLASPKVPLLPEVMIGSGEPSMRPAEDAPEHMQLIALAAFQAMLAKAEASGDDEGVRVYRQGLEYLQASIAGQRAAPAA